MGYRTGSSWAAFGDGSDGDLVLSANAIPAKSEYQFRSLTIAAGVTWAQRLWNAQGFDRLVIRCRTPIVLEGAITANGIACCGVTWLPNGGWYSGYPNGYPPTLQITSSATQTAAHPDIFPVAGGGANKGSYVSQGYVGAPAYYTGDSPFTDPAAMTRAGCALATFVDHRSGPYRIAAGCGGGADMNNSTSRGGIGGGAIVIYAPAILLGANARIEAKGGDGGPGNAGGGGGGSIQLYAQATVVAGDLAKCSAAGGHKAGTGSYDGLAGLVLARRV